MTVLRSGAATDVGRVRASNEDMALESPTLYAVADGMGGHVGGEVASRTAIEVLLERFSTVPTASGLVTAIAAANVAVWRRGQEDPDLRGMGTTLTVVGLVSSAAGDDVLVLANVGDSRAYLLSADRLVQLTADHSLAEEKVRQGQMSAEQAAVHPHRHILTRALGVAPGVAPDVWELHVHTGERLLLCSDGLSNEVTPEEMAEVLQSVREPAEAAQALIERANTHGGSDNITGVVVDVMVGEEGARDALLVPVDARPLEGVDGGGDVGDPAGPGEPVEDAEAAEDAAGEPGEPGEPGTVEPGEPGTVDAHDELTGVVSAVTGAAGSDAPAPPDAPTAHGLGPDGHGLDVTDVGSDAEPDGELTRTAMVVGQRAFVPDPDVVDTATGITPLVAADLPPPSGKKKVKRRDRQRPQHPRRVTLRVVFFVVLLAAIVAGAYYLVKWYATDNYFVTLDHEEIVVFQGRPGGLLGFDPKVVDRTGVTTAEVLQSRLPALRGKVQEPTREAAVRYVANLEREAAEDRMGTFGGSGEVFASTTTTTTTVPPPTVPGATVPGVTGAGGGVTGATGAGALGVGTGTTSPTTMVPTTLP